MQAISKVQMDALKILMSNNIVIHHRIAISKHSEFFSWQHKQPIKKPTFYALQRMGLIEKISNEKEDKLNKFYAISQKGKNAIDDK